MLKQGCEAWNVYTGFISMMMCLYNWLRFYVSGKQ